MNTHTIITTAGIGLLMLVLGFIFGVLGSINNATDLQVGGGPSVYGDLAVNGTLSARASTFPNQSKAASYQLTTADAGNTFLITTGGTFTLPPVSTAAGTSYRFVVNGTITASTSVASAEGDNITGVLIVAGAAVDCRDEDFINIVDNGEALGDFVEVASNGSDWLIVGSNALTSAKMTCTDPS